MPREESARVSVGRAMSFEKGWKQPVDLTAIGGKNYYGEYPDSSWDANKKRTIEGAQGIGSVVSGIARHTGHSLNKLSDYYIAGQQGNPDYAPKDITGFDYNNRNAPGNAMAVAKDLGAASADVGSYFVPVGKIAAGGAAVVKGTGKVVAKGAAPVVERALATETGALIGDTVKAGAAKASAAKATAIDTKEAVRLATSRTVDKAVAVPKATTAGVKSAARLSPAKEKALTQAANRENQLAEAAKNLELKYNRVTGKQEVVTDTSNMVIQKPLTRGDAFKSAYDAHMGATRAEAAANAAYRTGERATPFTSGVVHEAENVAKADFVPSHGRSTNAAIRTAQAATREGARAYTGLAKDINSSGGKAEEAIKGLEKDVETAFPKAGQNGKGKGKSGSGNGTDKNSSGNGSGKTSGDGSGNVPGSGKGNGGKGSGSENSYGNGLRNEPGATATKTGVPGTTNPRGGRPAPPEGEPFTKPAPEKLKPLPYVVSDSAKPELPDLTSGKIGLLEREEGLTTPTKPAVPAKPSFGPSTTMSPGVPDGASQVTSGTQLGINGVVSGVTNAGAQAAIQPAMATTPTPTATATAVKDPLPPKSGGGGGGGGKKPPPVGGMDFGQQDVKLKRVY